MDHNTAFLGHAMQQKLSLHYPCRQPRVGRLLHTGICQRAARQAEGRQYPGVEGLPDEPLETVTKTEVDGEEYSCCNVRNALGEVFRQYYPRTSYPPENGRGKWTEADPSDRNNTLQLQTLNHMSLEVFNMDLMEKFYTRVLGFKLLPRPNFPFDGRWLTAGGLFVHLIAADPDVPRKSDNWREKYKEGVTIHPYFNRRGFHTAFQVEDIQLVEEQLMRWGIAYDKFIVPGTGAVQVFFMDPEGNGIEVGSQYSSVESILRQAEASTNGTAATQ